MKKIQNKLRTLLCISAFLMIGASQMSGQITFPTDVDDDGTGPGAPIDGLIGVGLLAGAYFGLRKKISKQD